VGSRQERRDFLLLDFFFFDDAGELYADDFAATTELACCGCR